ncbi:MAG TPA: hypothetical protein VFS44_03485 [Gemmatimonadaceae bacterium]|nr:hypothetical protein [Gemmatimonadaceae bacterium]
MHLSVRFPIAGAAALAGLTLALAGCGSDITGANGGALTDAQLQSVGASIAAQVEGTAALMTMGNLYQPVTGQARVAGARAASLRVLAALGPSATAMPASAQQVASCVTPTPNPPTDTDNDQVPDQVALHFDCHTTDSTTFDTFAVTGNVTVQDPEPSDSGFTMNASASPFTTTFATPQGFTISESRTGNWSVAVGDGGLAEMWNVRDTVAITGRPPLAITSAMSAAFVPAEGASITMGSPLPAGSLTASGGVGVNDGAGGDFALTLETTTPLAFDATFCRTGATSFRSGEVHAAMTANGKTGYVRLVWSNCQSPNYTFVVTG